MFSSQNSQVSNNVNYIEDVFSTYLYTGTSATITITNNIDLAGKGGLVWCKDRSNARDNVLMDTAQGIEKAMSSNNTQANGYYGTENINSFNSTGFTLNANFSQGNNASETYVSWTFREQPKFFDIVTWTGNATNRTIAHALGAIPGCIIVKRTDTSQAWAVYHRSLANTQYLVLNTTAAAATGATWWNSTTPTSAVFSVGTDASVNASGGTYVAYIYAHDAGGFGLTGTDNVISCGTYTIPGAPLDVNLGYEPQWVLIKQTNTTGNWYIMDTMRGFTVSDNPVTLKPNSSDAEGGLAKYRITNTGFGGAFDGGDSGTFIYIAIRRGPMAVPTLGTSVYSPNTYTGTGATLSVSGLSFPPDMVIPKWRSNGGGGYSTRPGALYDKLRGAQQELAPTSTAAESTQSTGLTSFNQSGFTIGTSSVINSSPDPYISWNFRRAPGFFDEVCTTGFVDGTLVTHNLGVTPELIFVKDRAGASNWMGAVNDAGNVRNLSINTTAAGNLPGFVYSSYFTATTIDPTAIKTGTGGSSKGSGVNAAIYLFATCAGVSKVGSYTGNGSSQTIACGFTAGARFVLIKRTDSTGDWYVWDTARGIVSGNDPHLSLNTTAAEVTTDDTIDPDNSGFIVNQVAATDVNVSAATYIFLAIA
jgi:hypothetical protein